VRFLLKGVKTEVAKNLVLSEAEFVEFKQYCCEKGFDLSYFSSDISGSKEEIERYQFDGPKVIKLKRRRFSFSGTPYDVAEWQQQKWLTSLPGLRDEFSRRGNKLTETNSFERSFKKNADK
jgi:hypothetical protein